MFLSIDASGSMRSQDMYPNRLQASKGAARAFLRGLPPTGAVGLVAFAPRGFSWTIGGPLDGETLKEIARITGGECFHASTAAVLARIYRQLAHRLSWETRREEVSGPVGLLRALLLAGSWELGARAHRMRDH